MKRVARFQSVQPLTEHRHQVDQLAYYAWIDWRGAVDHLGLGSHTALMRLIRDHRLPYGRVGRNYRFRRDHLDQWAQRRGVESVLKGA